MRSQKNLGEEMRTERLFGWWFNAESHYLSQNGFAYSLCEAKEKIKVLEDAAVVLGMSTKSSIQEYALTKIPSSEEVK